MLKDSRVKVNETDDHGYTPLYLAARWGHLDVIRWWIVSGREMDLGTPGDVDKTDAIRVAKKEKETEIATLLERFKSDAAHTRHAMRVELGWYDDLAEMFALVVFVSDGLLQINVNTTPSSAARFFTIAPNGAVLSPGGIRQGDHPRQRKRGGIQGIDNEPDVVLNLHQLAHCPCLTLVTSMFSTPTTISFIFSSFIHSFVHSFIFLSFFLLWCSQLPGFHQEL